MRKLFLFAMLSLVSASIHGQSIPRAADGKPNFTGVWAGPGFTHRVGPGDTDTPRVTTYDPAKMSPFKPGGMLDATHDSKPDQLRIHSDQIDVIERLRYIDPTTVSYQVTIDDPKVFNAPWSQDFQMKLHPTWKIFEFVCEENNRCMFGKCTESDVQKTGRD